MRGCLRRNTAVGKPSLAPWLVRMISEKLNELDARRIKRAPRGAPRQTSTHGPLSALSTSQPPPSSCVEITNPRILKPSRSVLIEDGIDNYEKSFDAIGSLKKLVDIVRVQHPHLEGHKLLLGDQGRLRRIRGYLNIRMASEKGQCPWIYVLRKR